MEPVREVDQDKCGSEEVDNFMNDADIDDLTKLDDVTLDNGTKMN
jgi:hypothetical protein